jgi:abortive infection bacteriophage resistance protein
VLAVTRKNSNVAAIVVYLHKMKQVRLLCAHTHTLVRVRVGRHSARLTCGCTVAQVFEEYFKDLQEESIRDNFVIIYELLDEMMDFGYPQTTESKILQRHNAAHALVYDRTR